MPERLRVSSLPKATSFTTLHPRHHTTSHSVPPSMKNNRNLNHPELSKGQKKYLWSICSVYSTSQMKKVVQHQYMAQLLYEMEKGIVRTDDWSKYIKYIANSSQRKYQFTEIDPRILRTSDDQYKFRYYRDHPVATPTPRVPGYIKHEISAFTRPVTVTVPRRYVSKKRRGLLKNTGTPQVARSSREKSVGFVLPPEGLARPSTSMGHYQRSKSPEQVEGVTRPLSRIGRRR